MNLTVTSDAKEILKTLNDRNDRYLLLYYDTEGCGCGVNGVPTIRFTNTKKEKYVHVDNDLLPTLVHEKQAAFFAAEMKLDVVNGTFRLSSPEGILNPFIPQQSVCEIDEG